LSTSWLLVEAGAVHVLFALTQKEPKKSTASSASCSFCLDAKRLSAVGFRLSAEPVLISSPRDTFFALMQRK
jgi:hypothetical protein